MNKTIVSKKLEKLNYYEKFLLLRRHPKFTNGTRLNPRVLGSIGGKADEYGPYNVFLGTSNEVAKKLRCSRSSLTETRSALVESGVLVLEIPSKGRVSPVYRVNDTVLNTLVADVLLNRKPEQEAVTVNRPAETTEVPTPAPSPTPVTEPVPAPVEQPVVVVPKPSTDEQPVAAAPEPSTVEPPVSGETKPAPAPPRFKIPDDADGFKVIKFLLDAVKRAEPQIAAHLHEQAKHEADKLFLRRKIPDFYYQSFVESIDRELERKHQQKAHPDPLDPTTKSGLKA